MSSLLSIRDLKIEFRRHDGPPVQAVKGLSLELKQGESIAIVGESGSGKSATALALARLLPEPPARITASHLSIAGHEVLKMSEKELRKVRGKEIAYVFQEPTTSLNPVLTVRTQIGEALSLHRPEVTDRDAEILSWLRLVGITEPEKRLRAYPHELSGGMQQRVMIAMALCCQPKLLIADEPTTALDVTIQKQIMELLADLRRRLDMSLILITHNFGIIKDVADRVAVMFRGEIVETGPTAEILTNPQHPYTQALLDCVPRMGAKKHRLRTIDYSALVK
ncbi:peptide/nickel transport system ATP-binding protein/oligopeptide transport system ATP-binding protein [Prosthecobacter fusiformis]|uniref:Peptide/nickel transport system ATP-binding protein/oligopeptide transport system ATP-binding protein n=1 Tax=Prosthecobacter fusiformis TaxID=48464 RepID=A0A4R7SQZ1_9BACT|nr:ABC transporter ATP-binding protein [Prosthecobacter fusiformis]TDU81682.1 peptide/nickel transport system ATP-binding protein/oligopeptide transport system ATP-binding protein [Prosthecobacter fusiformis]